MYFISVVTTLVVLTAITASPAPRAQPLPFAHPDEVTSYEQFRRMLQDVHAHIQKRAQDPTKIFNTEYKPFTDPDQDTKIDPALLTKQDTGNSSDPGFAVPPTSNVNFHNFCKNSKVTLLVGQQDAAGGCLGMMMGFIAAHDKTTVAMLAFPGNNENVKTKTAFNIEVHYANGGGLGVFTDAQKNYGNTPMLLNKNGETFGHNHVTVQKIDDPTKPAPATNFTFFKGINFAVQNINGQQVHQVLVPNGLDKGNYRCCTILGGISHFAMPISVAQTGSSNDCKYFTVSDNGKTNLDAAGLKSAAVVASSLSAAASASSKAATATGSAAQAANASKGKGKGKAAKAKNNVVATSQPTAPPSAGSNDKDTCANH